MQDLEHVMMDAILRYDDHKERDWDENADYFLVHALYLLTELRSYESLPVIFDFLRQDEEFMEFWVSDWIEDYFHPTLYLLAKGDKKFSIL